MEILNKNQFVMCRGKKCCPIVTVDGDDVTIKDDYNSTIKMTMEQFMEIIPIAEHIKTNPDEK